MEVNDPILEIDKIHLASSSQLNLQQTLFIRRRPRDSSSSLPWNNSSFQFHLIQEEFILSDLFLPFIKDITTNLLSLPVWLPSSLIAACPSKAFPCSASITHRI